MKSAVRLGAVVVALTLSACSGNAGGDTTCAAFNGMKKQDQTANITAMLKEENGGKEPSNLNISATRISAAAFCKTLGRDSSKIRDIKTG